MTDPVREQVRRRYAAAATAVTATGRDALAVVDAAGCCSSTASAEANASCCGGGGEVDAAFGSTLYSAGEQDELPASAVAASLGCGNPTAVAELKAGERVLDLGSGGGIDVLLSARRVGPTGFAYGLDMTAEMLSLARANAAQAAASNVAFLHGTIEGIPLPDSAVDVVISNCVINLSVDKPAVFAEMFRVLSPGGRIGISDVVAEDNLTPGDRAARGSYVGCIAGALSRIEYLDGLADAGFTCAEVAFTHQAAPGMHGAVIRATKPAAQTARPAGVERVEASEPAENLPLPLACDLGPQDGQARLFRWQALHRSAAPTAHLHDGQLEVRYQPGPGVREELSALADAEQVCCSFVTWSVTELEGQPVLRVTAPPEAPAAVEPIAVLFEATRSSKAPSQ